MSVLFSLADKIALVTGGSRGIGAAITDLLIQQGAHVVSTATSEKGVAAIKARWKNNGLTGVAQVLNIADKQTIDTFFNDLAEQNLLPDILVNNAGITRDNLMIRMKDEEWQDVINTDLNSIFYMSKRALKSMLKKRWGRIINLSSVSGLAGSPGQANYAAAKAGMVGFSKSLAKEIATRGITVNCVAPGFTKSDMTEALPEELKSTILSEIPLQRIADPEEIAAVVAFLASPEASYLTGQTLHVNGGMYMV